MSNSHIRVVQGRCVFVANEQMYLIFVSSFELVVQSFSRNDRSSTAMFVYFMSVLCVAMYAPSMGAAATFQVMPLSCAIIQNRAISTFEKKCKK